MIVVTALGAISPAIATLVFALSLGEVGGKDSVIWAIVMMIAVQLFLRGSSWREEKAKNSGQE
jgi:high-affinity Fe2+/Pb2+ permease